MAKASTDKLDLKNSSVKNEEVVYGVYDNTQKGAFVKVNDLFIDNSKITVKDRSYFFHLIAVMVDSGIPLIKALDVLREKTENEHLKRVISTIHYNMQNRGQTLSTCMQKFPDTFSESEIGIVKSGEATGNLDTMLFRLSEQLEQSYELSLKVKGALVYPITILCALGLAGILVILFVIPKLRSFFLENNISLPISTQILIDSSNFIASYWWAIAFSIIGAILIFNFYINTESGKFRWHHFLLKMPAVGPLMQKVYVVKFVRLLSVLVESGLPITKVLNIIAEAIGNEVYKKKLLETATNVEKGEKISDNLENANLLFPNTLVEMIRIGENSATMDKSASKMANYFEKEIDHGPKTMMTILEPSLIIFVGLIVAGMAFAIMGPIFNLSAVV